jgi:MarR family transcriptional regulator, organic hydroperoxide resistance regulator
MVYMFGDVNNPAIVDFIPSIPAFPEVQVTPQKRNPGPKAPRKVSTSSDAGRLAEIFPRMMTALSQIAPAEELIHRNLTQPQIKVLNVLGFAEGPRRMSEIAKELGITQASLTETAKKLASQGYISRTRDAEDDRVVNVALTPLGANLAAEMKRKIEGYFNFVCDGLEPEDRKRLVESHEFIFKTYMDAVTRKSRPGKAS